LGSAAHHRDGLARYHEHAPSRVKHDSADRHRIKS
jgi:hypothetical protein